MYTTRLLTLVLASCLGTAAALAQAPAAPRQGPGVPAGEDARYEGVIAQCKNPPPAPQANPGGGGGGGGGNAARNTPEGNTVDRDYAVTAIPGVIAAGAGSRLRADGWTVCKPLVEVAGLPLIGAVLRNFTAAGVTAITVIVNESEQECVDWVRGRYPALDIDFIVKTTASSLESFREVTARGPAGPMLVSTVDAWCAPEDFARCAARFGRLVRGP